MVFLAILRMLALPYLISTLDGRYDEIERQLFPAENDTASPAIDSSCCAVAYDDVRNIVFYGTGRGVRMIRTTDPKKPERLPGVMSTGGVACDLACYGPLLYAACGDSGLEIWDVEDVSNPRRIATYCDSNHIHTVKISGSYAFLCAGESGLLILDVNDPGHPALIGRYQSPGYAMDVDVEGYYAFVADYDSGLSVVSIVRPDQPTEKIRYDPAARLFSVEVTGNHVYLACDAGLMILSFNNLYRSDRGTIYRTSQPARSVQLDYPYAYVADGRAGIRIINISQSGNPSETGYFDTPGKAVDLVESDGYAYIADGGDLVIQNISRGTNLATMIAFPLLVILVWVPMMVLIF